jgi:hypothetical protein
MTGEIDPERCPLCGEANECGMARDLPNCWCFTASVRRDVLERVPPQAQGVACVCRRCATGEREAG